MKIPSASKVARLLFAAAVLGVAVTVIAASASARTAGGKAGTVYSLSNATGGNAVMMFDRASDGTLTPAGSVPTGGLGSGGGLGSQNAVVLSSNGKFLFAVNAGDNTISAFKVTNSGLAALGGPVWSGGVDPISLTWHANLLFVLNAGDAGSAGNITGFVVGNAGLTPIGGTTRPLSGASVGPAQVQFSPDGRLLVVTEKGTNKIDTYRVHGGISGPITQPSAAATPFGFAFGRRGDLFVTDAVGGAPGASGLSSYDVSKDGVLTGITPFLGNTQSAACWVVVTKDGRFAFTTNTGSATISTYLIKPGGSLALQDPISATTGTAPTDAALAGHYLYAHVSGAINAFTVESNGALTPVSGASGLPAGSVGLAAS